MNKIFYFKTKHVTVKKILLFTTLTMLGFAGFGQLSWNAYGDFHYVSTFTNAYDMRPFAYQQPKVNTFGFNHVVLGLDYKDTVSKLPFEAHVALQAGDYVEMNYSAEPALLRHIYDANVAVKIHKYITLSGGIWGSSHMGAVSAKSFDNYNASFTMGTDFLPYYLTGATLTFSKSNKFSAMIGVFNGYQRIKDNNSSVSPGFQLIWTPNDIVRFNIGGIIGNEADRGQPQKVKMLFTPDITITPVKNFRVLVAGGYGRDGNAQWYNVAVAPQVDISKRFKWSIRGEYFNDAQAALGLDPNGVSIGNLSTNFDCFLNNKVLLRLEGKYFRGTKPVYNGKNDLYQAGLYLQFKIGS